MPGGASDIRGGRGLPPPVCPSFVVRLAPVASAEFICEGLRWPSVWRWRLSMVPTFPASRPFRWRKDRASAAAAKEIQFRKGQKCAG